MTDNAKLSKGFTLIEVMAALAILSIGLVVLIKSQTQSVGNVTRISNYEKAVFITENQLHWTYLDLNEVENWEDLRELSGQDMGFDWSVHIEQAENENGGDVKATLLKITAITTWPQGRGEGQFQLETWYLWGENPL